MSRTPRSLRGKVVVITGGARGIGAATARTLAARGANVAIGDIDGAAARQTAAALGGAMGRQLDVTDLTAFTTFLDDVASSLGPIDVLVNNAGIMPLSEFRTESDATTARQLEINLHAVIHGTREAANRMVPRGRGHIVNIASIAGKLGLPGGATYSAVKHGVVGLSEAVRAELRGSGVEISCVMPGMVRTELISGLDELALLRPVTAEQVAEAIARALEYPRFDVFVPRRFAAMDRVLRLLPRRAGEWALRRAGADRALTHFADSAGRAGYESRAASS